MELRVYDVQDCVTALGPGVRFAVWTQGCLRRCPGCRSPQSRPLDGGTLVDTRELAARIAESGREGVTISGGEPFLQAAALCEMIELARAERDVGVIVYTGCTLEELQASDDEAVHRLLSLCDLLIDGAYVEALNDGKNWRGSSNQRAIPLTQRYRAQAAEYGAKPASVEFFFGEEGVRMVGVPSRELLERFRNMKF